MNSYRVYLYCMSVREEGNIVKYGDGGGKMGGDAETIET
jgi:hypothetical protein